MAGTRPWPAVAVAAGLLLLAAPTASAQEPGPERSCTLTLQPTDSTESVSRKVGEEAYVTHIRNGMRWLCDPAVITADSAVQYEPRRTVVMIGSVHYRDTIRDLRSRRLTYYEEEDRVLAEDSVRLRQLKTGSVLRGPRVVFLNAVRGEGATRTVATRRPRMRIPAPGDTAGEPFRVTSDTAVLLGEREAEARGEVVVRRQQLTARGGYARFALEEGTGFLTRSPSVEGEDFRLTGDTVRITFEASELRRVRAVGRARLAGEEVDVRAPTVKIRVADEQVDEVWAFGDSVRPGPARALSAEQEIHGDSLHFSFEGGSIASIGAVGRALAMEVRPDAAAGEPAAPDTAARGAGRPLPDSTAPTVPRPDSLPPPDTAAAGPGVSDSAAGDGTSARPAPGSHRNWIGGDTVRALFSAAEEGRPDSVVDADTAAGEAAAPPAPTDSAGSGRRAIERLVAIGNARSFYRIRTEEETAEPERAESGEGNRDGLNYLIGDRITIRFRAGRPLTVQGERAIGVFLDPVSGEPGGGRPPGEMPDDTAGTESTQIDSSAAGDSAAADTARTGAEGGGPRRRTAFGDVARARAASLLALAGRVGRPRGRHTPPGGR